MCDKTCDTHLHSVAAGAMLCIFGDLLASVRALIFTGFGLCADERVNRFLVTVLNGLIDDKNTA